jgi:hypothetical protein
LRGRLAQVRACGRTGPRAASRGAVDHAEERPHRELEPDCVPRPQLLPGPLVHADLAPAAALAAADEQRAAAAVEVRLAERESLVDSQSGSPEPTIRARRRWPYAVSPAARITATISSTVGGSAG